MVKDEKEANTCSFLTSLHCSSAKRIQGLFSLATFTVGSPSCRDDPLVTLRTVSSKPNPTEMNRLYTLLCAGALGSLAHGQVSVVVLEPPSLAGGYANSYADSAAWGDVPNMTILSNAVTDTVVFAYDAAVADSLCCGDVVNAAEVNGKIAIVYRGSCNFSLKALNCQTAGAEAIIIIDTIPESPIAMGAGTFGADVTIPVFMITQDDGADFKAVIDSGVTVVAYLGTTAGLFENDVAAFRADLLMPPAAGVSTLLAQNASEFSAPLGAWLRNPGSLDQSEVTLTVDVSQNGSSVWSATGDPVFIASGDSAFVDVGTFSQASYSGQYLITYTLSIPSGDEFPLNNTLTTTLTFGDYFSYAGIDASTGKPISTGGVAFNMPTGPFSSCTAFRDPNASRTGALGMYAYAARNAPNSLYGELISATAFEWLDDFSGISDGGFAFDNVVQIAIADLIIEEDTTRWQGYIPFNVPFVLQDNVRYLFCLTTATTTAGQTVFLGTNDDYDYNTNQTVNDQPTTPIQNGSAWNTGFAGTTGSNGIRLVDAATIGISENAIGTGTAFPVPADRELRIPFQSSPGQFQLEVVNAAGEAISDQRVSSTGNHLVVNVANIPPGIYTFRLHKRGSAPAAFKVVIAH